MHTLTTPLAPCALQTSSRFLTLCPITAPKRRLMMPQLSHLHHALLMLVEHIFGDDTEEEEMAFFPSQFC